MVVAIFIFIKDGLNEYYEIVKNQCFFSRDEVSYK